MSESLEKALVACLSGILAPTIRRLVSRGVGYQEFSLVAKWLFVHVATAECGLRRRQANISRVAALTGVTRKEVSRNRELNLESLAQTLKLIPLNELVERWFTEPPYCNERGEPFDLPFQGRNSFSELASGSAGDISAKVLKKELMRNGMVAITSDGCLRLVKNRASWEDQFCGQLSELPNAIEIFQK